MNQLESSTIFNILPYEAQLSIMSHLSARDLKIIASVSSFFYHFSTERFLWKTLGEENAVPVTEEPPTYKNQVLSFMFKLISDFNKKFPDFKKDITVDPFRSITQYIDLNKQQIQTTILNWKFDQEFKNIPDAEELPVELILFLSKQGINVPITVEVALKSKSQERIFDLITELLRNGASLPQNAVDLAVQYQTTNNIIELIRLLLDNGAPPSLEVIKKALDYQYNNNKIIELLDFLAELISYRIDLYFFEEYINVFKAKAQESESEHLRELIAHLHQLDVKVKTKTSAYFLEMACTQTLDHLSTKKDFDQEELMAYAVLFERIIAQTLEQLPLLVGEIP